MTSQILLAQDNNIAWIQYKGKGSFLQSSDLKAILLEVAESSGKIFLDLSLCEGMDSTFMGVLVLISKSLDENIELELIYVNPSLQELMEGLGLQYFLTIKNNAGGAIDIESSIKPSLKPMQSSLAMGQDNIHAAHQALSEMSSENAAKFKNILDTFGDE